MMDIGINIGEAVEAASVAKAATAIQAEPVAEEAVAVMRLVAFKIDRVAPGKITVPATSRQQGIIAVGPASTFSGDRSKAALIHKFRAHRWVLDPVNMDEKLKGKVRGSCSISPSHRVQFMCPECGHEKVMWSDQAIRTSTRNRAKAKRRMRTADGDINAEEIAKAGILTCLKCESAGTRTELRKRAMKTVMVPVDWKAADPIFSSLGDPALDSLTEAWAGAKPTGYDDSLLPRVWAVYPKDKAPNDWLPGDDKARQIEERVTIQGGTIRPFGVARKDASGEIRALLMEASQGWQMGWVRESDLYGENRVGFNRKMLAAPHAQKYVV